MAPRIRTRFAAAPWLAACLLVAGVAIAQSIRIPDFRENAVPTAPAPKPGEPCDDCGVIRSIQEIHSRRPVEVPRAFQTNPMAQGPGSNVFVGAVVVLPMSETRDQSFVGGVGTPEMRRRFTETTYEIVIRLDSGGYTSVQRQDGAYYQVGDRVRVRGIELVLLQ